MCTFFFFFFSTRLIAIWYLLDKSEHYINSQYHPVIVQPVLFPIFALKYANLPIINDVQI